MFGNCWWTGLNLIDKVFRRNSVRRNSDRRTSRRQPRFRPWLEYLEERCTPAVVSLAPVADNTLYEDATGNLSNGAGQHLYVGNTFQASSSNNRRALVKFDLSAQVPAGSTINNATLTLRMSLTNNGAQTVVAHRLLQDWGEGTSNAALGGTGPGEGDGIQAESGDATWIHTFFSTQRWTNAGGDFVAAASASRSVSGTGSYQWTAAGMTADVQQWLDNSSTNFGWVLTGNESAAPTAKQFDSRQNATAGNRPVLSIDFTPAEPDLTIAKSHSTSFIQGDAADTYTITVSNSGQGPSSGTVTVTDTVPAGLTPTEANSGISNGWSVSTSGQTVTATRNDELTAGASYPDLIVTVAVAPDAPTSVTNTATVSGGGETNTDNNSADDPTTIFGPNQPPLNTLPATFTGAEDTALALTGISVADPDAAIGTEKVTLAVSSGALTVGTNVNRGVTAGQVSGNGTSTVVIAARLPAINATLADAAGLIFVPLDNASSNVILTIATDDQGNTGTGGAQTDTDSSTITLDAVNDAPVNTMPATASTSADTPLALTAISIADVDAGGDSIFVVLNVTNGTLAVSTSVTGGVTASETVGNSSGLVTRVHAGAGFCRHRIDLRQGPH